MNKIFLIKKPHITEKATSLQKIGKYVFIVEPSANKNEIKKVVKQIFGVDVVKVNIINKMGKVKRFRNKIGHQVNLKKAFVSLKKGQTINLSV